MKHTECVTILHYPSQRVNYCPAEARNAGRTLVVGIEEHSTSGKTTLGKSLAIQFGAPHIGTDSYVDRDKDADSYVGILTYIDSSCCAGRAWQVRFPLDRRDLFARHHGAMRLEVGVFVYCRRITRAGLRADDPQNSARQGRPVVMIRLGRLAVN